MKAQAKQPRSPWRQEISDLIRGASGGFLFGIPLVYTMEVWWLGSFTEPSMRLIALLLTFIVLLLLNRTAGFRERSDVTLSDAAKDAVEAMAVGLVCSTLLLLLLQEISLDTPLGQNLGKLTFESVPFAIGVTLANQLLRDNSDQDSGENGAASGNQAASNRNPQSSATSAEPDGSNPTNATLRDIGATLIGAMIIAFNIAPTDEVRMLSAAVSGPWLVGMIIASLLISYGIVFAAGFHHQTQRQEQRGIFQQPMSETLASYIVSLLAAVFMLWFFRQLSHNDPWQVWLTYTLVLGLPATIGGAAGRLAI